jgi:hypothetical protein
MATSVPNTNSFSLQDVVDVTGGTSLSAAIANSIAEMFDPQFKGIKTGALNDLYSFRNYKPIQYPTVAINISNFSDNISVSNISIDGATVGVSYPITSGANRSSSITLTSLELLATVVVTVTSGMDMQSVSITDSNGFTQCVNYHENTVDYLTFYNVAFNSSGSVTISADSGSCYYASYNLPSVSTTAISSIVYGGATSGGNISSDGGQPITSRGVCWIRWYSISLNTTPTIADAHTSDAAGAGSFTSVMTGLEPNSRYYVRAYATNSVGTAYGAIVEFNSLDLVPGTPFQGGQIFYIFQPEDAGYVVGQVHGIICATESTFVKYWGANNDYYYEFPVIVGSYYENVGQGGINTQIIHDYIDSNATHRVFYAAWLVYELTLNGFSDWVMPSKNELLAIHNCRYLLTALPSAVYWSSTEYNKNKAWCMNMSDANFDMPSKRYDLYVIPIRYF